MDTKRIKASVETHTKIKTWAAANGMTMIDALVLAVDLLVDGLPEVDGSALRDGDFALYTDCLLCDLKPVEVFDPDGDGVTTCRVGTHIRYVSDLRGYFYGPVPRPKTKSTA